MKRLIAVALLFCQLNAYADWEEQLAGLKQSKEKLLEQYQQRPYGITQHEAIRNYFDSLTGVIQEATGSDRNKRKFNKQVRKSGIVAFCTDSLLSEQDYLSLMKNCTQNTFFLCAETVKKYSQYYEQLKSSLDGENRSLFEGATECAVF
jgi:hypothetical protein